jgi:hypothetical protein
LLDNWHQSQVAATGRCDGGRQVEVRDAGVIVAATSGRLP